MTFERTATLAFSGALAVSAGMSLVRHEEEFARRAGLKGTQLTMDSEGRTIEFTTSRQTLDGTRPVLVLESGLGAPLECWDWVERALRDKLDVLRYHRRGYARTKSVQSPAQLVEHLLRELAPTGPVVFASHSIGALVTGNVLAGSEYVRSRTRAVYVLDGTDAVLLEADRASAGPRGRYRQMTAQSLLATVTGIDRWVQSPVERDVEYRPDVQRAFVVMSSSVRTLLSAQREYLQEPTGNQHRLRDMDLDIQVLSAADNVDQQRTLADRLGASFEVVPGSSHRSIIGRPECAQLVADHVLEGVNA